MNSVSHYDLDRRVFESLNKEIKDIKDWGGAASGIADYVGNWGIERFWAMSRSSVLKDGLVSNKTEIAEGKRRYFSWKVAREVLCEIVGNDVKVKSNMTTDEFQKIFSKLDFNEQVLLSDLLIVVADTIQFWTMRLKDAKENGNPV